MIGLRKELNNLLTELTETLARNTMSVEFTLIGRIAKLSDKDRWKEEEEYRLCDGRMIFFFQRAPPRLLT